MTPRDNDRKQREDELDEALEETFPASDPIEPAQPGGDEPTSPSRK